MNEQLALKTLSDLVEWDDTEARDEFAWLRLMSKFKYDVYQGYEPGMRFFESLIGWLNQFSNLSDKQIAYQFLKKKLIFFSRNEIAHLVHRLYPEVRKILAKVVADDYGLQPYQVWADKKTIVAYDILLRQSLFVGLSDGAMMDVFRRSNEVRLSNEQIVVAHEISDDKWNDMHLDLDATIKKNSWDAVAEFKHIFLIDDFTASGKSLIDLKENPKKWVGKIGKFIERNHSQMSKKRISKPCCLHVHHYLASSFAENNIKIKIQEIQNDNPDFKIELTFGHIINTRFNVSKESSEDFFDLLSRHYDPGVQTDISGNVMYGYKNCALPVVLEHNTPNNTVGLIWAESVKPTVAPSTPMKPLFRRRTRH